MHVFALLTSRFVFSLMMCVQQLDVEPKEESRAYTTFVIPRERESQLPVLMLSSAFSRISHRFNLIQTGNVSTLNHKLSSNAILLQSEVDYLVRL
jgi:hypothetical protein